jgi:hypothetical protein
VNAQTPADYQQRVIQGVLHIGQNGLVSVNPTQERIMAKGQDAKKAVKKKSEKTLKEKRTEKKQKKANKK